MSCCLDCGKSFGQVGSGRPRKRCFDCSPRKRDPKGDVRIECAWCGVAFFGRANAKYCCVEHKELGRSVECAGCGKRVAKSRTSAESQYCLACRRAGLAPYKHGQSGYNRGCRCDVCRGSKNGQMREYWRRRVESGNPARARTKPGVCAECGISFLTYQHSVGRFCSSNCYKVSQGWSGEASGKRDSFYVNPRVRLAIYKDANWLCQLCECPTRPDGHYLHPRYPTLDHIVPRAHGGSDNPENLRLACRQCNITRGARVDWVPELVEVADEPVKQTA